MSDLSSRIFQTAAGQVQIVFPGSGGSGTSLEDDYLATLVGVGDISFEKVIEDNTVFPSGVNQTYFDPTAALNNMIKAVPITGIGPVSDIPVSIYLNGSLKYADAVDLMTRQWDKDKRRTTFNVTDQLQVLKTINLRDDNNGGAITNPLGYTTGQKVTILQLLVDIFKQINPSISSIQWTHTWSFMRGINPSDIFDLSNVACYPYDDIFNSGTALDKLKTLADVWKAICLTFQARSGMLDINTPYFIQEMESGQTVTALSEQQVKSWRDDSPIQAIDPVLETNNSSWIFDIIGGGWGTWTNAVVQKTDFYTPFWFWIDAGNTAQGNLVADDDGTRIGGVKNVGSVVLPGLNPSMVPPGPYSTNGNQIASTFYNLANAIGNCLSQSRTFVRPRYTSKLAGVDYGMDKLYSYGGAALLRPLSISESLTTNGSNVIFEEMPA